MKELPLKDDATKAAIDYLEKQGYSVVEWHKFDAGDESTYPKEYQVVITDKGIGMFYLIDGYMGEPSPHFEVASFDKGFYEDYEVKWWANFQSLRRDKDD